MCELKSKMNTLLQDYYEEYNRMNESRIQQKCENDLELRSLMDTVRDNEKKERDNLTKIIELEKDEKELSDMREARIKRFKNQSNNNSNNPVSDVLKPIVCDTLIQPNVVASCERQRNILNNSISIYLCINKNCVNNPNPLTGYCKKCCNI